MAKTKDKRRFAVIGGGGWGKNHARALHEIGVPASSCDKDELRAREQARLYDAKPYFSLEQLLEDEVPLDGCIVCTPTKTHFAKAKKIMEKGVHVFVEKPLAFSSCECEEMIEIAKRRKVILTSGY